jgi:Glycoside-hydrolase family GH114
MYKENDNGLGLTKSNAIDFMNFLVTEAQKFNLSSGLKNAGELVSLACIAPLSPKISWAFLRSSSALSFLLEQCSREISPQRRSKLGCSSMMLTLLLQVQDLLPIFQYSVNEQCVSNTECSTFASFIKAGKPVFHIEYPTISRNKASTSEARTVCSSDGDAKGSEGFSTVLKKMQLDGWVEFCDGNAAITDVSSE